MLVILLFSVETRQKWAHQEKEPLSLGRSPTKAGHTPSKNPPSGGAQKKRTAPRARLARARASGLRQEVQARLAPQAAGLSPRPSPPNRETGRSGGGPKRKEAQGRGAPSVGSRGAKMANCGKGQKVWWAKKGRSPKSPRAQKKVTCLQLQDLSFKVQTSLPELPSWRCKVNDGGLQMVPLLPWKGKGSQD